MLRLHFNVQIATSIQKQQSVYKAVITVHLEALSTEDLTIIWCESLPS